MYGTRYSMSLNFVYLFVLIVRHQKYAEFFADFQSAEIIGKKCTRKKLFAKIFSKLVMKERKTCNFASFFAYNFFVNPCHFFKNIIIVLT
jgi:hypothetical protein